MDETNNGNRRYQTAIAIAVPALLAIALIAVCIWASMEEKKAGEREAALTNAVQASYRQAMYQLADNVNDMQTALKKLQVTGGTAQHVLLLSDVWRLSGAAVANMGNLPASHADTAATNAFIVRAGDYAHSLSRRILTGGVLLQADYDQLDKLYEASVQIGNRLSSEMEAGAFPTEALGAEGFYTPVESTGSEEKESIADYPTLIYDGPFSESNEETKPKGLPEGELDENAAKEKALAFLGGGSLTASGLEEGTIPVYGFYGTDGDGRNVEITVTKQGGAVLWMMADVPFGEDGVPEAELADKLKSAAANYLELRGYENMEPTYAQYYDGIGVFNFAAVQDGVILYSDLIKVYVEKATERVAGFDANNYLMMHTARTLGQPTITEAEARQHVSDNLTVLSTRLALIPLTASSEKLCYEFKGQCRGTDFIVYIDAATGTEQEIFEILNSDEGQLVV